MDRISKLRAGLPAGTGVYISSYANIFYYSGFASEDAKLVITEDQNFLITDSRYLIQAKTQAPDFTILDVRKGLGKLLAEMKLERLGYEEENLTCAELDRLNELGIAVQPMQAVISGPRAVKDKHEIQKIQAAEQMGDAAFSHILEYLRPGLTEWEVALELEYFMKKNGARRLSFDTIVASGLRSAMPHGTASDKVIEAGDFVTMDFGCVLDGYCSDMTRTVVMGKASARQKEIYDVVLRAQETALAGIACGIPCSEIDRLAREVIQKAGYGAYFGHSLGHSVGIEIHESPNFSPKSQEHVTNGHVITVEPGIYIEDFGGVRIEDVIAVQDEKVINLTASSKEFIEIF